MSKALEVSPDAIEQIQQLRKDGYILDFKQQGVTPSGLDFCRAERDDQSFVVYVDGACLHPGVDYMDELYRIADECGYYENTIHAYYAA